MEASVLCKKINQLPLSVQHEVSDYVEFLLRKYKSVDEVEKRRKENEARTFFNSINIDLTNFKFDRDEANER